MMPSRMARYAAWAIDGTDSCWAVVTPHPLRLHRRDRERFATSLPATGYGAPGHTTPTLLRPQLVGDGEARTPVGRSVEHQHHRREVLDAETDRDEDGHLVGGDAARRAAAEDLTEVDEVGGRIKCPV